MFLVFIFLKLIFTDSYCLCAKNTKTKREISIINSEIQKLINTISDLKVQKIEKEEKIKVLEDEFIKAKSVDQSSIKNELSRKHLELNSLKRFINNNENEIRQLNEKLK
ncbi:hypothetical protein GVAV_001667 [Gurleya vavrai]